MTYVPKGPMTRFSNFPHTYTRTRSVQVESVSSGEAVWHKVRSCSRNACGSRRLLRRPRRPRCDPGDGSRRRRAENGLQARQEGGVSHLEVLGQRFHDTQRNVGLRSRRSHLVAPSVAELPQRDIVLSVAGEEVELDFPVEHATRPLDDLGGRRRQQSAFLGPHHLVVDAHAAVASHVGELAQVHVGKVRRNILLVASHHVDHVAVAHAQGPVSVQGPVDLDQIARLRVEIASGDEGA
ncbi:unnamed protein product [Ixodes persulcatus]